MEVGISEPVPLGQHTAQHQLHMATFLAHLPPLAPQV